MKNRRNYYRILQVQPDAPTEVIKASYRTLMQKMKLHPDMGGDAKRASLINQAYAVLSDSEKRSAYDRQYAIPNIKSSRGDQSSKSKDEQKPKAGQKTQAKQNASKSQNKPKTLTRCLFCNSPFYFNLKSESLCSHCLSPLHPPTAFDLENVCQRKIQRIITGGEITFYTEWPQTGFQGRICDLSPTGMRFLCKDNLKVQKIIKIKGDRLESIAQIVNCQKMKSGVTSYSIGVEFRTLLFHQISGTFVAGYV